MALHMQSMPFVSGRPVRRALCGPSQRHQYQAPGAACVHPTRHLHRQLQTPASHRFFDIRIQSSWGTGASSSQAGEASVTSRWWNGGRDSDSPILQDPTTNSSSAPAQGRFANLFSNKDAGTHDGSSSLVSGGSSYIPGSIGSIGQHGTAADNAAPWVLVALVPTMVWCVTWALTGGMVTLANTCMGGMTSIAQLLFPLLPVKGVNYDDIAASLVKGLSTDTDHPATWTRPGLWIPAWVLRLSMMTMFRMATASSTIAATLIPVPQWLAVSGVSQGLMYFTCLLLMLPLGLGLSSLAKQTSLLTQRYRISLPKLNLPIIPRINDNTVLALKLAGLLAWPCISAAAIMQPLIAAQTPTPSFPLAAAQVATCAAALALLLTVAVTAGRFAVQLSQRRADVDAVQDFGFRVGLICAVQALLNVVQVGLGLVNGQAVPGQLVMPLISTFILGRVVWSIWRLFRIGSATPSMWLQLLTLTPPGATVPASR